MRALRVAPLWPARIAAAPPFSAAEFIGGQQPVGAPPPSTVLGALGAALGVRLNDSSVRSDPTLGIGVLAEKLAAGSAGPIVAGPLVEVETRDGRVLAAPLQQKGGVSLVKLDTLRGAASGQPVPREGVVARLEPLALIGVSLRDVAGSPHDPYNRTVEHMFVRTLAYFADERGRGLRASFVYKLGASVGALRRLVRFGGEGRQAVLEVLDAGGALGSALQRVVGLEEADPGCYVVLSHWPLLPKAEGALLLRKENFVGLEVFDEPSEDIVGVPPVGSGAPQKRVVRLGLGFSEVAGLRRPQILALPPGTVVHVRRRLEGVPRVYRQLLKAGYASLLKLDQ